MVENEMHAGSTYRDIFNKVNLRRTEITTGVYTVQVLSGIYLIGYATYFFQRMSAISPHHLDLLRHGTDRITVPEAGLATDQAFNVSLGFLAVGILGACLSWVLLVHFGRRTIYNNGLVLLAAMQFLIGILDCVRSRPGVMWVQASLMIVWNFFYNFTIGPIGFTILCETSATRVRGKTIAFATAVQAFVGIGMTVAVPYLINPEQANLRGKLGFFFGGLAACSWVWAYFRVPETVRYFL